MVLSRRGEDVERSSRRSWVSLGNAVSEPFSSRGLSSRRHRKEQAGRSKGELCASQGTDANCGTLTPPSSVVTERVDLGRARSICRQVPRRTTSSSGHFQAGVRWPTALTDLLHSHSQDAHGHALKGIFKLLDEGRIPNSRAGNKGIFYGLLRMRMQNGKRNDAVVATREHADP